MLTLTTTGPQSAALSLAAGRGLTAAALVIFPFGMLFARGRRKTSAFGKVLFCLMLTLILPGFMMLGGCGTNGSFGSAPTKNANLTPIGTFTIRVRGNVSGVFQDIAQINLVVQ
jgi:hypothetical protein